MPNLLYGDWCCLNILRKPVLKEVDEIRRHWPFGFYIIIVPLFYRGHGTFVDCDKIVASVTGTVEVVNKLISVKPLKTR